MGAETKKPPKKVVLLKLARLGGFEPPTAWFVARYSIQLSYSRINIAIDSNKKTKMARLAGFEPATTWFEARYSIQLSYSRYIKVFLKC